MYNIMIRIYKSSSDQIGDISQTTSNNFIDFKGSSVPGETILNNMSYVLANMSITQDRNANIPNEAYGAL